MKRLLIAAVVLASASAFAAGQQAPSGAKAPASKKIDEKLEKSIREALPVCADTKVSFADMVHKLPANLHGTVVLIESGNQACEGQFLNVVSDQGGFYLGFPWFLDEEKGTIEEKLRQFTWNKLQMNTSPVVDRTTKTREGLYKVTLFQATEGGKLPIEGEVDPNGTVFFMGHFRPSTIDAGTARVKALEPLLSQSPATGAAKPVITVVEFSDFECPSCARAAGYMKPILDKYGDKVRYVRYDLPLVQMHPWALSAAIAGRAVFAQKPELFWDFKKAIYENQEKLSAFTIADFTRGFAQDHELDMKKYDADVASDAIRESLLKGAALALGNDVRATPSYMVNGVLVDSGVEGKALADYIAARLK